jgi:hypothetical protein
MTAVAVPDQNPSTPPANTPKPRRGPRRDRNQLLAMQQTLFELTQDKSVMPHIRAACARAWSDLQERKRVLDGKPLPGQLRPDLAQVKERKRKPSLLPLPEVPPLPPYPSIVENTSKESLS